MKRPLVPSSYPSFRFGRDLSEFRVRVGGDGGVGRSRFWFDCDRGTGGGGRGLNKTTTDGRRRRSRRFRGLLRFRLRVLLIHLLSSLFDFPGFMQEGF